MQDWGIEDEAEADLIVHHIASDWSKGDLAAVDQALCAYADKLTRTPQAMSEDDIKALRAAGLDDRGIHDATQVIGYFNYINRVADALHVEPEKFIRPWEQTHEPLD